MAKHIKPWNIERAEWARAAVEAFQAETRTDDENALCDLLADLMHLADLKPKRFGKFEAQLDRALDHYKYETKHPD